MMLKASVIEIRVNDLEEALVFYCKKIGFTVEEQFGDKIVQLSHQGIPLIISEVSGESGRLDYPQAVQTLVAFEVENLLDTTNRFRELGIPLLYDEPQECPVGIYNAFRDPFGNVHELLEFTDNH